MTEKEFRKVVRRFHIIKHMVGLVRDDNRKIQIIEELARVVAYRTRGIYADQYLERTLCKIGSKIKVDLNDSPQKGTVLHVMTQAGIMGGHTRVVDHWIRLDSGRRHSVVLTSASARNSFPQFLKETVENSGGKLIFLRNASHISRAEQLLEIAQYYEKIILHTYMEDTIPTLAFSNKKWKRTIYLFNHANFRFWLGTSIADVCLDITSHDAWVSRDLRGIKKVKVLPIPMLANLNSTDDEGVNRQNIREKYGIGQEYNVVTTMANKYKYQTISHYNFFEFVDKLLSQNRNMVFFAIGPNKEEDEWKKLSEKYPERLQVMGILDKYRVDEILSITDLYVASFPVGSCTACLDAAVKGIKVVSLITAEPPVDSLTNRAKTVDELIFLIEGILDGRIKYKPDQIQIHLKEDWMNRLEKIYNFCPRHQIHTCKSKVLFDKEQEILMGGLEKKSTIYTETWTVHGEVPMYDLNSNGYVLPYEMDLWHYLFDGILC